MYIGIVIKRAKVQRRLYMNTNLAILEERKKASMLYCKLSH